MGESGVLYKWIEAECFRLGILSARPQALPLTILTPEDYEGVLALGGIGIRICDLLLEKACSTQKWGRMDGFLHHRTHDGRSLRLPSMERRFEELTDRALERMRRAGIFEDSNASEE